MKELQVVLIVLIGSLCNEICGQQFDLFSKEIHYTPSGDSLQYRFLAPEKVDEKTLYPLFVFLHGSGERGADNESQLIHVMKDFIDSTYRAKYPTYIVVPQCPMGVRWGDGFSTRNLKQGGYQQAPAPSLREKMVMEIVQNYMDQLPIDPNRIYLGGLSMGGTGTWSLLAHYPNQFAAAVPICGSGDRSTVNRLLHIPIWIFHGTDDSVVPVEYSRTMTEAINKLGGQAILTEFAGVGHDSWNYVFSKQSFVFDWLFSQRK